MHEYAAVSSSIGLTVNPIVNFSGVIGTDVVSLGTDLSFDTKSGNFTKCNAGLSFSKSDLVASVILCVVFLFLACSKREIAPPFFFLFFPF